MNADKMVAAKHEAKRFLAAVALVEEIERKREKAAYAASDHATIRLLGGYSIGSSRETGALRRASMDLTRSLADLRRP